MKDVKDPEAMDGFAVLQALAQSPAAAQGVAGLLGMRSTVLERGHAEFTLTPRPEFANFAGTVNGGVLATVLDAALACTAQTMVGPGQMVTTSDLKISYMRPVAVGDDELTARGEIVHAGRSTVVAQAQLRDSRQRLVAHAVATHLVVSG